MKKKHDYILPIVPQSLPEYPEVQLHVKLSDPELLLQVPPF